jgi:PEP-CTERM motif
MIMKKLTLFVTMLLASTATAAQAGTFFTNGTGLAGAHSTVTFDELTFPDNTLITNQYAGFGVTLNNGVLNAQDGFTPRNYVANFDSSTFTQYPDLQISFGSTVSDGAFDLVTNDGNTTINVFLGATLVDSAVFATSTTSAFFGYTGGAFDRFQILAPDNAALLVGTVQFAGGAVPEPASWALMLSGFGLAGAAMRRRQSVRVTYA